MLTFFLFGHSAFSQHFLCLLFLSTAPCKVMFELTGNVRTTPGGLDTREWQCKNTDYRFWQEKNQGHKSFNSGAFNKKLKVLQNPFKYGIVIAARAKALLHHRKRNDLSDLTRDMPVSNFYSMAENLPHLVRAMKMIVSTGVPNSFFNNAFVKDYLSHLNPKHRTIYRRTLLRLLRVFVACQDKEVRGSDTTDC